MKRGIVLNIENNKAVVMTADGQFISIPHQAHMRVGEEASIPAETAVPTKRKPKRVYWYSGVAAAILLFFIPFFYLTTAEAHPVVAYVSLDINPSIELGVDKQQRVQELNGLNRDGQAIVSKISYKGKSLEDVAASIMNAAEHFLDKPDKDIVITSYMLEDKSPGEELEKTVTEAVDQKVQETIKQIDAAKEPNVTVLSVPSEVREEASANGISSGKMAIYLIAKDEGYNIELEQIKAQSLAEATKSAGGVKKIVEKGASKEKLKELAVKEKQNKSQATATPVADKAQSSQGVGATINKTAPVKPTESPLKHPTRPSYTEKPSWSKENNSNKPSRPAKPVSPTKPTGSEKDKWQSGNWSNRKNSDNNSNDEKDDDKKNGSNNWVNGLSKLEKWTWQNDDNDNDDDQGNDRKSNRNDNKKDNDLKDRNDRDK